MPEQVASTAKARVRFNPRRTGPPIKARVALNKSLRVAFVPFVPSWSLSVDVNSSARHVAARS